MDASPLQSDAVLNRKQADMSFAGTMPLKYVNRSSIFDEILAVLWHV